MNTKPNLETCLSPALLHLFERKNAIVVIIDIFRATSTIAAALHNGAKQVIPVASVEECIALNNSIDGCITAGERDGKVASGLVHGNSPLEYPIAFIDGKTLALTTTNGTKLLHMVGESTAIITGSFLNIDAVCNYLIEQNKNVLLACAAWKDRVNFEDSLFAGMVANKVKEHFSIQCDSTRIMQELAQKIPNENELLSFLKDTNHYRRLTGFGLLRDLEYCTTLNLHPVVPKFNGRALVKV